MDDDALFTALITMLGLIIGSFLNVVIHRIPKMEEADPDAPFNLLVPSSHCPKCGTPIKLIHNVPIVSYLALRGRCGHCAQKISARYFLVECVSATLSTCIAAEFGPSSMTLALLIFTWMLIPLCVIKLEQGHLPETLAQSLTWTGLILSAMGLTNRPADAILGAILGYGLSWLLAQQAARLRKTALVAHSNILLSAGIGAWIGWHHMPYFITLSIIFWGLSVPLCRGFRKKPIPLDLLQGIAGWVTLFRGELLLENLRGFANFP
jgi:leader peptidase (prepilin peptidase) / N-methyltransferase